MQGKTLEHVIYVKSLFKTISKKQFLELGTGEGTGLSELHCTSLT